MTPSAHMMAIPTRTLTTAGLTTTPSGDGPW